VQIAVSGPLPLDICVVASANPEDLYNVDASSRREDATGPKFALIIPSRSTLRSTSWTLSAPHIVE